MKRISPAALKKMKIKLKRAKSCIKFRCPYCGNLTEMFPGCKIKEYFCYDRFDHISTKMVRINGFACPWRPDLDNKRCDGCGMCDTGTDADFDRYAVQVQNGEGYYDASGTYQSYYKNLDEY